MSPHRSARRGGVALALLVLATVTAARADDGMFRASPVARAVVDFDAHGFVIRGERTFLASGSVHYPRVPRALWRDRLLRLKRAGLNTVETYAFWNVHEPSPGRFDFSGERDLGAFLDLAHELGLFVIVRAGPYICGEWDSGGFPVWLRFEPGLEVRTHNRAYEQAVDRWYTALFAVLAPRQIHRGGSIVLVQLENEHADGNGRESRDPHFAFLRHRALALGLEVPHFYSGVHHGHDPAGEQPFSFVQPPRDSPWFTTELWAGWYNFYGPLDAPRLLQKTRGVWKTLAFGAGGFNLYVFHGGTHFGPWNDNDLGASYDYGAAVGEGGDLRPIYHRVRRAAALATTFPTVIAGDLEATPELSLPAGVRAFVRGSRDGRLVFVDNARAGAAVEVRVPASIGQGSVALAPGEIRALLDDVRATPSVRLTTAAGFVGRARAGATTTLVLSGPEGRPLEAKLRVEGSEPIQLGTPASLKAEGRIVAVHLAVAARGTAEASMRVGAAQLRVLAVSDRASERAWIVDASDGRQAVVLDAGYVGEVQARDGAWHATIEQPAGSALPAAPPLGRWEQRSGAIEAEPDHDTGGWLASASPRSMGADGDASAYAWYRTTIRAPSPGTYSIYFEDVHDWAAVFVDGKPAGAGAVSQRSVPIPLASSVTLGPGAHTLAVFTAHFGRPKLIAYTGPIDRLDAKGITGAVYLRQGAATKLVHLERWQMKRADSVQDRSDEAVEQVTKGGGTGWRPGVIGRDVFVDGGRAMWFRTPLGDDPAPFREGAVRKLLFSSVDDRATIYVNGHDLGTHSYRPAFFEKSLDRVWRPGGDNVLAVLVEKEENQAGFLTGAPDLLTVVEGKAVSGFEKPIEGWLMRGGVRPPDRHAAWAPLGPPRGPAPSPMFYRATFPAGSGVASDATVLRWAPVGLSRGFAWINGHPLGRYPDKIATGGLYLPAPWLLPGTNELVVFDEEGRSPAQTRLVVDRAASRLQRSAILKTR